MALQERCHLVRWSLTGNEFAIASLARVLIFELRSGAQLLELPHSPSSPLALEFVSPRLLVTGGEGGCLRAWDLESGSCVHSSPAAHQRRIKALCVVGEGVGVGRYLLISACSDGFIKLWKLEQGSSSTHTLSMSLLLTISTRCRVTCLEAVCFTQDGAKSSSATPPTTITKEINKRRSAANGETDVEERSEAVAATERNLGQVKKKKVKRKAENRVGTAGS